MTIAPIVTAVTVKVPPARAFALFAQHMAQWWNKNHTIGQKPFVEIVVEPVVGGRWFERDADGDETNWGKVLAYDPPHRLLLGWQINASWKCDPNFLTEVEITFATNKEGGTDVRLEHRDLERFGADAGKIAISLGGGWSGLIDAFGQFVDQQRHTTRADT